MVDLMNARLRTKGHKKALKRLGRPKGKKEIEIKGVIIGVRISKDLKEKIQQEANLNGFTLSPFISMTLKNLFGGK